MRRCTLGHCIRLDGVQPLLCRLPLDETPGAELSPGGCDYIIAPAHVKFKHGMALASTDQLCPYGSTVGCCPPSSDSLQAVSLGARARSVPTPLRRHLARHDGAVPALQPCGVLEFDEVGQCSCATPVLPCLAGRSGATASERAAPFGGSRSRSTVILSRGDGRRSCTTCKANVVRGSLMQAVARLIGNLTNQRMRPCGGRA